MMPTQYVAIKFNPMQSRTYTYSNDGPEVFPGDRVKVPARPDGWAAVTVESVSYEVPPFACKAIMGRVEDAPRPAMMPLEQAEADRCKASGVRYEHGGICTTCGKAPAVCDCLPF